MDMTAAMKLLIAASALALFHPDAAPAGTTYRVGPGCTYSTIQAAVDAIPAGGAGAILVRTRSLPYGEQIEIINKSVQLRGGYNDCTSTDPSGVSAIDPGLNAAYSSSPAVSFSVTDTAAATGHRLDVFDFDIIGSRGETGTGGSYTLGGAIRVWTDSGRNANVVLSSTWIYHNHSVVEGGGISLNGGGNGTLDLIDSRIFDNEVTDTLTGAGGGGLYCRGGYHIRMVGGDISSNRSARSGGGMYLTNGCEFSWYAGAAGQGTARLSDNQADYRGGGIYAWGGAKVRLIGAHLVLFGDPRSTRPLRIHDNQASGNGGAIFAFGAGTEVVVDRAWIYNNTSLSSGGAAMVGGDAVLFVHHIGEDVCHSARNCSRVFGNFATHSGGAVRAFNGGQVRIWNTKIQDNITGAVGANDFRGDLVAGNLSNVTLVNSLISRTLSATPSGHALVANDGAIFVLWSTIADTRPASSLGVIGLRGAAALGISNSIIHEANETVPIVTSYGGTPTLDCACVIWHDDALGEMGCNARTEVADPSFVSRENGLYYLQPGSPAINYCDIPPFSPDIDLDWNPRGVCHSTDGTCSDGNIYDLGAYELPLGVFSDRFEN